MKIRVDGSIHKWVGKYSKCKKCTNNNSVKRFAKYKEYFTEYRRKNKDKISIRTKANYAKNRKRWWKLIATIKRLECSKCGYDKSWAALDFHHLDPSKKVAGVHELTRGVPTEKRWLIAKTEMDKCIILCANCHREEHIIYDKDK